MTEKTRAADAPMLTLYMHPLASFCQKVLIALYESGTPFEPRIVDLGDEASRMQLTTIWPVGKFPVLRDELSGRTIPESTIIIEYLAQHYPGKSELIPKDADKARDTRLQDRFYDHYIHEPMQKIITDRLRPQGKSDPHGVEQARAMLATAYGMIDCDMANRTWAMGDTFTMADCAAAPSLFYANQVQSFGDTHHNVARYFDRLLRRPSFERVVEEARPYFHMVPK